MNALENYISSHNTTYFMNGMSLILVSKKKENQLTTTSLLRKLALSHEFTDLWITGL